MNGNVYAHMDGMRIDSTCARNNYLKLFVMSIMPHININIIVPKEPNFDLVNPHNVVQKISITLELIQEPLCARHACRKVRSVKGWFDIYFAPHLSGHEYV